MKMPTKTRLVFTALMALLSGSAYAQELCGRVENALIGYGCPNSSALCSFLIEMYTEARLPEADGTISVTTAQLHADGVIPTGPGEWQVRSDSAVPGGKYAVYVGQNHFSTPGIAVIRSRVYIPQSGTYKLNKAIRRGGYNAHFTECANPTECNDFFGGARAVFGAAPEFVLSSGARVPANPIKEFAGDWSLSGTPTTSGLQRTALEWPHGVFHQMRLFFPRAGIYEIITHARSRGTEYLGFRLIPENLSFAHPTHEGTPLCSEL